MMKNAFSMQGIEKEYKGFTLGPVDLTLEPGTVLGLVGPNGSGKTTTMHLLTGLVKPSAGNMEFFDSPLDPKDPSWKCELGFVSDEPAFFEGWNGEKNLEFLSGYYPKWSDSRMKELAERFDLDLTKKVKKLSKGNRVKLALVAALAHSPKLCLFDEPTAGLDPVVRTEVLDVFFDLMADGEHAILYSTHILTDIDRLADELVFLHDGKIMQRSHKDDLLDRWRKISFRYEGEIPGVKEKIAYKCDGTQHQFISTDYEETLKLLQNAGAENIQHSLMNIEEIAVQILKGEKNGARQE